ncbi:MAG: site-specific integrase [Polyangiaceae bacterium]
MDSTITTKNWQARMTNDMKLTDFRPSTQDAYLMAARLFVEWAKKELRDIDDDDVRNYFLHLREVKKNAPSTVGVAVHALKFFFRHTLGRNTPVLDLLRISRTRQKLPVVLSRPEVRSILEAVRHPVRRMALTTIYALGLRLGEGISLETTQIDADRLWSRFATPRAGRTERFPFLARCSRDFGSTGRRSVQPLPRSSSLSRRPA